MTETANLGLPFIDGSQAQKHITHNEALRILDDAIQIAVLDTTLTVPPVSPADGERHIVASGATGAWAGQGSAVATWETNAWRFLAPKAGWCVWSIADEALLVFDGSGWVAITAGGGSPPSIEELPYLGINTPAIETNLLTVRSNDVLFHAVDVADAGTGNVRLQLSKEAAEDTASVVFADAFFGHAEFGLTGDNDFHLKVSEDGESWRDALKFDHTTGRVSFPSGGARELLTANRTYYVRTDGNDSNNGLSNTSGGAFLTIQKAWNVVLTLDLAGFTVTIQLADGAYTAGLSISAPALGGTVILNGNSSTPTNVVISTANCVALNEPGTAITLQNLRLTSTNAGISVLSPGALVTLGPGLSFAGTAAQAHMDIRQGKILAVGNNFTIAGGGNCWVLAQQYGVFESANLNITFSGTPAWTGAGIAIGGGIVSLWNTTMSGAATGKRYDVNSNGVLNSFGAGTSSTFFPGNSNGIVSSGGQQL
jgi:hypothetical protein